MSSSRWCRSNRVLPGFRVSLAITSVYVGFVVLVPVCALVLNVLSGDVERILATITHERALAAYRLSLVASLMAGGINAVFGFLVAWVLVRYHFPGKAMIDGLVDLPFALPTAVAGLTLTALYASNGWFGAWLEPLGIKIAFAQAGVVVALTFIGLPFVVRTVQPALEELDPRVEEAAMILGATRWQSFRKVVLPTVLPSLLTGFTLAFARALGEYGSIVFISGNLPYKTEIMPLLIVTKLEQYDYLGATSLALVLLLTSFVLLLGINALQRWAASRRSS